MAADKIVLHCKITKKRNNHDPEFDHIAYLCNQFANMEGSDTKYSPMQQLKRSMFAMRNGVVADALRQGGSPFKIIFGVNLPQLAEIASGCERSREFAARVWANSTTRESMLIAPMLMPPDEFDRSMAMEWISQVPTAEVSDVLCLKLLRHTDYALDLARELCQSPDDMARYTGLRLMCNLAPKHPQIAAAIGRAALPGAKGIMRQPAQVLASYAEIDE